MKILIVTATYPEIKPLLSDIGYWGDGNFLIKNFTYQRSSLDILITGVGLMHTAYFMGKTLSNNNYDLALNFGIAGSFHRAISIGEVVNVMEEQVADMGVEAREDFSDIVELNLLNPRQFPYDSGKLRNKVPDSVHRLLNLKKVKGISVNKVSGNRLTIQKIIQKYHPDLESMEGAAFLYACLSERVPCLQIRAVSNYVEHLNKEAWNIPFAIEQLHKTAGNIIHQLLTNNEINPGFFTLSQ
ncbi:MAG: futalosine hydrolase [Candidatus Loosdrechtia sp.]|uniref:futalosine hydrolase n=1 Tax=Candidatus Loosdrechtia sp. TaxID=3101272 RepID=UPI003A694A9D|nr:MAG: futalosine hydrolase [Candidatus Jettenia sp. AMX2]